MDRSWRFDTETISVAAEAGKVLLAGAIHSRHDRQTAAIAAWEAPGVVGVDNDIAAV
jgi:osmotically-inducible protein OsmY